MTFLLRALLSILGIDIDLLETKMKLQFKGKPDMSSNWLELLEALESGMCNVIKIRLKSKDATRSGKGNQPLNIKTAVEWKIVPNFRWNFYSILFLVASLLN